MSQKAHVYGGGYLPNTHLYIEYAGRPVPAPNVRVWTQWMLTADRTVAKTRLPKGRILVSTVFVGAVSCAAPEPSMLYETCVFAPVGSAWAEYRVSYGTREDALAGHGRVIQAITTSWELDTTRDDDSLAAWNTAVDALLGEMQRYGETDI